MASRLLTPPLASVIADDLPVVFLAGPIQGAPDWQTEAAEKLLTRSDRVIVANPRRGSLDEKDFVYAEQVDWESTHLRRAAQKGVLLFWLAAEIEPIPGRAYAQTTRFELAEWKIRHQYENIQLVVGIEEGYSGAKYIRHRFGQDCPDVPILGDLEETCQAALQRIQT